MTLKVWLRADDYDFDLLARMFAVGDTRFVREGARRYLTNRELDELAESGEVPHPEATEPNAMIYLTYVAGLLLAVGLLVLGIDVIRGRRTVSEPA